MNLGGMLEGFAQTDMGQKVLGSVLGSEKMNGVVKN